MTLAVHAGESLRRLRPVFLSGSILAAGATLAWAAGELTLRVVDADSGQPIACRMHLLNEKGRPQKAPRMPFWKDHFVFPGNIRLKLPRGTYNFTIERGPEYRDATGHFVMSDFADDQTEVKLHRAVNMADEGWWSGDLHIHRAAKDIELLMQAEDLHIAPIITWWNDQNPWRGRTAPPQDSVRKLDGDRFYDVLAGEDEREGGALLYFRLPRPLAIAGASREYPSPMTFLLAARESPRAWIDIEKPFWWDVPVWLASGKVDSIGLANNHMCRGEMLSNEAWGRPRDTKRLPDPLGNGRWSQEIYYHILNCGLRIPPSAGSASGVLPNPVGYNRVYVWVDKAQFSYESWWEAFKMGRVVVTNGPLVRPLADGRLPGHVFRPPAGQNLSLDVMLNLTTRDKISYLDLVKDGQVAQSIPYDEFARSGHFRPLEFDKSGWFLVRAVADVSHTYRFASSGPWYVEMGEQPQRISKASVRFFLDWMHERRARIKLDDPDQLAAVLKYHDQALQFWEDLLSRSNAE